MTDTKFKVYLSDGDGNKTVTVNHPKLTASEEDFAKAGNALSSAYGYSYVETTIASETVVHAAN